MIINAFILAFRQITRNYVQAFLTMLGVIIGVGSVIISINLGSGTQNMIKEAIESLGSNLLMIHAPRSYSTTGVYNRRFFTLNEVEAIKDRVPDIKAVAPVSSTWSVVKYTNKNIQTNVTGVTDDYFTAVDWDVYMGRKFENREYLSGEKSCIIGESVKRNLFGESDPIGEGIIMDSTICYVAGVLESKGQGGRGNDQDDIILMPLKTFQRHIKPTKSIYNVQTILVGLEDDVDYKQVSSNISVVLRDMRNITSKSRDTFEIQSTKEIQETINKSIGTMTLFITAVAGVSLLVGGIGIMNIMLVSVTERTKEIGTRLAIGALEKEVLLQFLIESATISAIGGVLGLIFGFFMTIILADKMHIPFYFNTNAAILSFFFSAFIGILFGFLPARKASRLNPIDALRHE